MTDENEETPDPTPTGRQLQVLKLLATGWTNREIADEFGISIKTIDTHRINGLRTVGCRNNAELVHYAMTRQWIPLLEFPIPRNRKKKVSR